MSTKIYGENFSFSERSSFRGPPNIHRIIFNNSLEGSFSTSAPIEIYSYQKYHSLPMMTPLYKKGAWLSEPKTNEIRCLELITTIDNAFRNMFGMNILVDPLRPMRVVLYDPIFRSRILWNRGTQSVNIGEVDLQFFKPFETDLTGLAHHFGHGLTDHIGELYTHEQSLALNESFSDIIATMVQQYEKQQGATEESDWLIEKIFNTEGPDGKEMALRSMKDPGTAYSSHPILGDDPQIKHMANYEENQDKGIISGIPNHAFYIAATTLGGTTWENAGKIWLHALSNTDNDTFEQFAVKTVRAAKHLGFSEPAESCVAKAWESVGVRPT
jgi:hypothetical protein